MEWDEHSQKMIIIQITYSYEWRTGWTLDHGGKGRGRRDPGSTLLRGKYSFFW